jgi:hypothetical protein
VNALSGGRQQKNGRPELGPHRSMQLEPPLSHDPVDKALQESVPASDVPDSTVSPSRTM